jgi:type IV secretion system protein VirB10
MTDETREEAMQNLRQETEEARKLGRQFSGDRLKRAAKSEWLTKGAFLLGTALVVGFIFTHEGKEERARKKEVRVAAQAEEPSVRDFRPPVMPVRADAGPAKLIADPSKSSEKPASRTEDPDAAAKRRKAEQIEEARTRSDLLVKASGGSVAQAQNNAAPPQIATASPQRQTPGDLNGRFAEQASGRPVVTAMPRKLGNLECLALQGKLIDAELETAINTDLPGQIRALVSTPLYAEQGREPLVPPGSRLNGVYNSAIRKGQVRVFAIWNRLIRPDGVEITLDSAVTDALGRAGLAGETDNHFGQIFGMSALLSIIGAGAASAGVSDEARYNSANAYRQEIQQSFARTADRVLEPYANIPPTISVPQGERIKVFLNRDLDFCPLKAAAAAERMELVLP